MSKPEPSDIAVVARLQPGRAALLLAMQGPPVEIDFGNTVADLAVDHDCGRIGIVEHQRRMCCGRAKALFEPDRHKTASAGRAAAIDHDPLTGMAELERQGRGATRAGVLGQRRRSCVELKDALLRDRPPSSILAQRLLIPFHQASARNQPAHKFFTAIGAPGRFHHRKTLGIVR